MTLTNCTILYLIICACVFAMDGYFRGTGFNLIDERVYLKLAQNSIDQKMDGNFLCFCGRNFGEEEEEEGEEQ